MLSIINKIFNKFGLKLIKIYEYILLTKEIEQLEEEIEELKEELEYESYDEFKRYVPVKIVTKTINLDPKIVKVIDNNFEDLLGDKINK